MRDTSRNSFGAKDILQAAGREYEIFRLDVLQEHYDVARLPFSLKILLENLLRHEGEEFVSSRDVESLAGWDPEAQPSVEIAFMPARVLMQDFTGVPAIVDLAAMRDAVVALGGDPSRINPLVPAELVIDHSVQVDAFGSPDAFRINAEREFERNRERYAFLRWGQQAFERFAVVPPDTGIVHQVNLEHLARVVFSAQAEGSELPSAYPDTLIGTDSHTTMINGLGVLGWGVGGIEAEAAMLGQPLSMLIPQVLGMKLHGHLRAGATATDLVLTVTERLRERGVVGMFVEFFGEGLSSLPIADRATIGNMSPEFGCTCAIFPIDSETLRYLQFSGRSRESIELVEAYAKTQWLWHDESTPEPVFSDVLEFDLGEVVPSIAGPKRPQDRISLADAKQAFEQSLSQYVSGDGEGGEQADPHDEAVAESYPASDPPANGAPGHPSLHGAAELSPESSTQLRSGVGAVGGASSAEGSGEGVQGSSREGVQGPSGEGVQGSSREGVQVRVDGQTFELDNGDVVIAAITSCTNTSNPSVMIGAGILARNAVAKGLARKPWVKTSLAPGSKVVTEYLQRAGLTAPLQQLGFDLVGYGCTTCIGNSGPLQEEISQAIAEHDLAVASVLSGNRNFEGRINPDVKMNYLASPPLCVAYALAGTMNIDLTSQPLGCDQQGKPVHLADIWPDQHEVARTIEQAIESDMFRRSYAAVFDGDERWRSLQVPGGELFSWEPDSTYVRLPPYFENMPPEPEPIGDIQAARVLALLGDSVTTDHISPAGSIKRDGPAGAYLLEHGVSVRDFNSYGARRGNHEVMMRGTFANTRLHNLISPEGAERLPEGGWTYHFGEGGPRQMSIYDAAMLYKGEGVPLVVIGGREYGSGSSRDWAAKGTMLLGVKAVIAESFERIHRSNLVGMGVLPLQLRPNESLASLGLTGSERLTTEGLAESLADWDSRREWVEIVASDELSGREVKFDARVRIDTPREAEYCRHGGILPYVLRRLLAQSA